jgi:hypothetical protein
MPIWIKFLGGTLGISEAWNQGMVCIRSSKSISWGLVQQDSPTQVFIWRSRGWV